MNLRSLLVSLAALSLGLSLPLAAADGPLKSKPGYNVLLEVSLDENGVAESSKVVSSDDTSVSAILNRTAMEMARDIKLPPRLKDGQPVKFTVRAPFHFPVEGDEGPESDQAPRPVVREGIMPVYPRELAEKGEAGAAILEIVVGVEGKVSKLKVLRSSHPAFAQAASAAVERWTFIPAKKDGGPVESRWNLAVCFETDVRGVDWTWRVPPRPSLGSFTAGYRTKLPAAGPTPVTPLPVPEPTK